MASININNEPLVVGSDGEDFFVFPQNIQVDITDNTLVGGLGNDFYEVDGSSTVVIEDPNGGTDTIRVTDQVNFDTISMAANVENAEVGGSASYVDVVGNDANNVISVEDSDAYTNATLYGEAGNDILNGDASNNVLDGGTGVDTMRGFGGNDLYIVDNAGDKVIEDSATGGLDAVLSSVSYTLTKNVEMLQLTDTANINGTGNELDNYLYGNTGNNKLDGGAGNDMLVDTVGNNTLIGGTGNDTLLAGAGNDVLDGGANNDLLSDFGGNNTLIGGAGEDTLSASDGNDVLSGGDGNDLIIAGHGDNKVTGGAGDDGIIAGQDNDVIDGGAGNDYIDADNGNNVITGGAGNDEIYATYGSDTLDGGAGDDVIIDGGDGAGANTLQGGEGNDLVVANADGGYEGANYLFGGSGNDILVENAMDFANEYYTQGKYSVLNGGAGDDQYYLRVSNGVDKVQIVDASGKDTVHLGGAVLPQMGVDPVPYFEQLDDNTVDQFNFTLAAGIENVDASGANANAYLVGNADGNLMIGSTLSDVLIGNAGNDTLDGRGGADDLVGGTGNDVYIVDNADDTVVEDAGAGTDKVISSVSHKLESNVENLTLVGNATDGNGNSLDNTIVGNSVSNSISGGDGNDWLSGGNDSVADTLWGGNGNDVLTGQAHDVLYGGTGNDTYYVSGGASARENSGEGTDTVISSGNYTLGGNLENLTLAAGMIAKGNDLDNTIVGNDSYNILVDGGGNDVLVGGKGSDSYYVTWGNNGNGRDTIVELAGGGDHDKVYVNVSLIANTKVDVTLGSGSLANVEDLDLSAATYSAFSGSLAFNVLGSAADNNIFGSNLDDKIDGGAGNDYLVGGLGNDTLIGGLGNDTYMLDSGDVVTEAAYGGTDTVVVSNMSYTLGANLENLSGYAISNTGSVNLVGNDVANVITAGQVGTSDISLVGGKGDDTYVLFSANDVTHVHVVEASAAGFDTVQTNVDNVTLADNIEKLVLLGTNAYDGYGNALDNTLVGNANDNWLAGGAGNDSLVGGLGNDDLDGGTGKDSLVGGLGNDTYYVDSTGDMVVEGSSAGYDTEEFMASGTYTLAANVEEGGATWFNTTLGPDSTIVANITGNALDNELWTGNQGGTLDGGAGNDYLSGYDGNDKLIGGAGNDYLDAGNGNNVLNGDAGNDELYAGTGNDVLNGGDGNDYLDAGNGNNVLNGDAGNDELYAGTGDDTLSGGTGNDTLASGNGDDILDGGTGNDTLDGGLGNDVLVGGTGDDVYYVNAAADVVTEGLTAGFDTVFIQSSGNTSFTLADNVEKMVVYDNATQTLVGNALANTLVGNDLANTLDGGKGADVLMGGAGDDTYYVDTTADLVIDQSTAGGFDVVHAQGTSFNLASNGVFVEKLYLDTDVSTAAFSGIGNELDNTIVLSGSGTGFLSGGGGNDSLVGGDGRDTLMGGAGNDYLDGGAGADTLYGGLGNDTYVVDSTSEDIHEARNEGVDTVISSISYALGANVENLILAGTADLDGTGNTLDNVITGNGGANTLDGGLGSNTLVGGAGDDTYIVASTADVVVEGASAGTDTVVSSISYTLGANVENLTLTGTADLDGTGNTLDNVMTGNDGANTLTGLAGNDTYIIASTADVVVEGASAGTDTVVSSISYTLGANVENLVLTGIADLDGTGNALDNTITGNDGVNTLSGLAGNDTYIITSTADVVVENASEGTDTVVSSISYTLGANVENLTLATGTADLDGTGNGLDNTITGNDGLNTLDGGDGNDWLYGNGGDDTLFGGAGNDYLDGGLGNNSMAGGLGDDTYVVATTADFVTENASEGTDTVVSSISYTLGANVENLTLTTGTAALDGTGNALDNVITGNDGANTLSGLAGADTLSGAAGNDVLEGGTGVDQLTGGAGNDVFVFAEHGASNADVIADFVVADDSISLAVGSFAGLVDGNADGVLDATDFGTYDGSTWGTGVEHIAYNAADGNLYYSALGDGTDASLIATLTAHPAITNADILVV